MAEQKIQRIRNIAARDFYERFVETRTPVIIEGIFDGWSWSGLPIALVISR